jgi:hypothetical protein
MTKTTNPLSILSAGSPRPRPGGAEGHGHVKAPFTVPVLALVALGLYCGFEPKISFVSAYGIGFLIATASALVGALLGFLFAIPRSTRKKESLSGVRDTNSGENHQNYSPNTNLEDVSDWLTKILVGVGLVQIGSASGSARRLIHAASEGLGDTATARVVCACLLITFLIFGFIQTYLWTSTAVTSALERRITATVQHNVDIQFRADAHAQLLVSQVLDDPRPGVPLPSQEELNDALEKASDDARVRAFLAARELRRETWRDSKDVMARTIPVFKSLISVDKARKYHRTRGELGFALKDKVNPDWSGALQQLTEAIDIRGPAEEYGWELYEYNRVRCLIHLDPQREDVSSPETRAAILADMSKVKRIPSYFRQLMAEDDVRAWLQRNNIAANSIH